MNKVDHFKAYGHVRVVKKFDDHDEVVYDGLNQITTNYLDLLVELLLQRTTDRAPDENQLYCIWFESSSIALTAPSLSDEGPEGTSTVVGQPILTDARKLDTGSGADERVAQVVGRLEKAEGNGAEVRAVNLFNKGSSGTPPNPATFVAGTNNVYCLARQLVGPFTKQSTFAVEVTWGLVFQAVVA